MMHRIFENTPVNITVGVIGSAVGFLMEHAGTFASVATGVYMVLCAVEKIRNWKKKTKE